MKLPWHKKPVTHAVGLWIAVGFGAVLLIVFLGYMRLLAEVRQDTVQATPLKARPVRQLPSLFGTITAIEDGMLIVDSKQSFSTVLIDDVTDVKRVGGGTFSLSALEEGMKIMATGYDSGDGQLLADALVVLDEEE